VNSLTYLLSTYYCAKSDTTMHDEYPGPRLVTCSGITFAPTCNLTINSDMEMLQRRAVRTVLYTTRHVTRFTANKFVGLQQSTDVCLTTPVWLSLMMTFSPTSPQVSYCRQNVSGSDWSSRGGLGPMLVIFLLCIFKRHYCSLLHVR